MSSERILPQEDSAFSPRHDAYVNGSNARNRVRTVSGSSSNQDLRTDSNSALLDVDDDVIEGQGYRERVVIITQGAADEDSGISEAPEDHLLAETRDSEQRTEPRKETLWHIAIQVFIPFLIAGFGMMAAGLLLDKVQASVCTYCILYACMFTQNYNTMYMSVYRIVQLYRKH